MKTKFIAIAVASLFVLVGCGTTEEYIKEDAGEVTIQYRGEDIHCVLTQYDRSASVSCDFERFYVEHPELTKE